MDPHGVHVSLHGVHTESVLVCTESAQSLHGFRAVRADYMGECKVLHCFSRFDWCLTVFICRRAGSNHGGSMESVDELGLPPSLDLALKCHLPPM